MQERQKGRLHVISAQLNSKFIARNFDAVYVKRKPHQHTLCTKAPIFIQGKDR